MTARPARFPAVDLMRGFVMVLMTVDHASETMNHGRVFTDSVMFWKPGSPLPAAQFLTRWMTHLCAPTFVFLAGVSLAIAVANRRARLTELGDRAAERAIDRYILTRGALIVAFEVLWMSPVMLDPGRVLFQVLYAIGASLIAMALLRRLSDRALGLTALAILLGGEAAAGALHVLGVDRSLPAALLLTAGFFFDGRFIVAYPLLPWLAIMMLGWLLGRRLLAWRTREGDAALDHAPRVLATSGVVALATFGVLRGIDGYGNMLLHRDDGSLVHWLHVSKYPPSITFATLELGIASLLLAGCFVLTRRRPGFAAPAQVFGQVALFYYLLHIHLLHLAAWVLGIRDKLGLASAYAGALAVLLVLYPLCVVYRRYKAAHPTSLARFV
ncbi:MAG: hypothetical protein QOI41_4792 [Myxococcales bacterium]|nr:hypothetical protein [Myxococcales bacterium]